MDQILPFVSDIGFPAIVAFYLLYRIETKLDAVIHSLQSVPEQLRSLLND